MKKRIIISLSIYSISQLCSLGVKATIIEKAFLGNLHAIQEVYQAYTANPNDPTVKDVYPLLKDSIASGQITVPENLRQAIVPSTSAYRGNVRRSGSVAARVYNINTDQEGAGTATTVFTGAIADATMRGLENRQRAQEYAEADRQYALSLQQQDEAASLRLARELEAADRQYVLSLQQQEEEASLRFARELEAADRQYALSLQQQGEAASRQQPQIATSSTSTNDSETLRSLQLSFEESESRFLNSLGLVGATRNDVFLYNLWVIGQLVPLGIAGIQVQSRLGTPYRAIATANSATANSVTVKAQESTRPDDWFYLRRFFNAEQTQALRNQTINLRFRVKGNGTLHAFWLCAPEENRENGIDFTDATPTGRLEAGRKSVELNETFQEVTLELDLKTLPSNYNKQLMLVMHTVGSTSLEIQNFNIGGDARSVRGELVSLEIEGIEARSRLGSPYTVIETTNSLIVKAQEITRPDDWFYLRRFFNVEETQALRNQTINLRFRIKGNGTLHSFWLCARDGNRENGIDFTDATPTGRLEAGRKSVVLNETFQAVTLELDLKTLPSNYNKQFMLVMHTVGSTAFEIQCDGIDII